MKICVPSTGKDLSSAIDSHFGRAPAFAIFDTATGEVKFYDNEAISADRGAGVKASQFVLDKGVDVLVCDNLGQRAKDVIGASGIKVIQASGISVQEAIELAKQ